MKKKLLFLALGLMFYTAEAQVKTPPTSTKTEVHQVVGLTDVSIDYSRPNIRGRLVYGDLVPYGRLWRTGANMNSVITFGSDVTIKGKVLPKGSYALYTIPKVEEWEVIFYKTTDNWGLPQVWDEADVALRVKEKVISSDRNIETFTLSIENVHIDYADLEIRWEKTIVPIRFYVPTDALAMQTISETFDGPTVADYYSAAEYYFLTDKELEKALLWIDEAIAKSGAIPPYYFVRLKSQIQFKMGDKEGAITSAKKSLELSEQANNLDYIKINQDAIKAWSK